MIIYVKKNQFKKKFLIGWREWVKFPQLGIDKIKAKIDTGARTSTLHALNIVPYINKSGKPKIKFQVYPEQHNSNYYLNCSANLVGQRNVKNSGGDIELRYIINTILSMAGYMWSIELTLTNRDSMGFRLLLGRTALSKRFLISPNQSFIT